MDHGQTGRPVTIRTADLDEAATAAVRAAVKDLGLPAAVLRMGELQQHEPPGNCIVVTSLRLARSESGELLSALRGNGGGQNYVICAGERDALAAAEFAAGTEPDDVVLLPLHPAILRVRLQLALTIVQTQSVRHSLELHREAVSELRTLTHEINNPLFAVMGNAQMLREEYAAHAAADEFLTECAEVIETESIRVSELIRRVREHLLAVSGETLPPDPDHGSTGF